MVRKKLLVTISFLRLFFCSFVSATSQPSMSRIYGDDFVGQVSQTQSLAMLGTLDQTFGIGGSLSLSDQFASSQAKFTIVLSDGSVLVLLDDGTNSKVVKYTSSGALFTTTGGTFGTASICTLTGLTSGYSMMVDALGRILVIGNNNGSSRAWIRRLTATGAIDTTFNFTDTNWSMISGIGQQSCGRLIVVGKNASNKPIIGGLLPSGDIDTTFGTRGYTPTFNGNLTDFYHVIIGHDNTIFVSYKDLISGNASIIKYSQDGTALVSDFGTAGIKTNVLDAIVATGQTFLAFDSLGNLIVAGLLSSGTTIQVKAYDQINGLSVSRFANPTITASGHTLQLSNMVTTSDGNILLIGSDVTNKVMRIDALTSTGMFDLLFNGTGTLTFNINSPSASSILLGACIAPTGQIYAAGYQVNATVTTPYLSVVNNAMYVTQIAQYPALTTPGTFDQAFGLTQNAGGIVRTFDGVYGVNLNQTANGVIELISGKILVGMSGCTNTDNHSNMMLTRLHENGTLDATFSLVKHGVDEYLHNLIELSDTSLLVCGYDESGSLLRKYDSNGNELWSSGQAIAGNQGLGIITQGTQRVLLFEQTNAMTGSLSAYNPVTGALDATFNARGSIPGKITTADFGGALTNMGPLYGYAIDEMNNIFLAYKNTVTNYVDVVSIYADGHGLISLFGTNGVVSNVCGVTIANPQDVRMVKSNEEDLTIAIAKNGDYRFARILQFNGSYDTTFNGSGLWTLSNVGTSTVINKLTVLNNNKIYVTGYDNLADDSMLVVKILDDSGLDTTFNAQGPTPGILSCKIGNIVPTYNARIATGLAVQSLTGDLIISAYEKSSSSLSIPMALHIYGETGTTEVVQYAQTGTVNVAGVLDDKIDLTSLIAAGSAKVIYAYPNLHLHQNYILVGIDTGTSTIIARIRQNDMALDATGFNSGAVGSRAGTVVLPNNVTGINHISIDGNNNILVGGSTGGTSGWAYSLAGDGTFKYAFNTRGLKSVQAIRQQAAGRFMVTGVDAVLNRGVVVAYQSILVGTHTTLQVDTTFNPLAVTSINRPGWYKLPTIALSNMFAVDVDGTIVVAFADTTSNTVKIARILANGGGFATWFGTLGIVDTGIIPTDASSVGIAIDGNRKVVVASSAGGNSVTVGRYTLHGQIDRSFNSTGALKNITGLGSAGVTLKSMLIDVNNKILIFGDNTSGANGRFYAVRLTNLGDLDTSWNNVPTSPDVQGISTCTAQSSTNMYQATIFIDGTVYMVGLGTTNKPLLLSMHGDNYVAKLQQDYNKLAAGTIDPTLDTITPGSGSLNLQSYLSSLSLSSSIAQKLYIYPDGSMLLAFNQDSSTILVKMKADFTLDTTGFNRGAVGSPAGSVKIPNASTISDLFVNNGLHADQNIYMTGMHAGLLWTASISSTGITQSFIVRDSLSINAVSNIRKTTNSRTLLAGSAAGSINQGIISAYLPNCSCLDKTFGNGTGYYATGINSPISAMVLDEYDRMYIAYVSRAGINVDRVLANGTGLQAWSNFGTKIAVTRATQIKMALDQDNNQLVVAAQDGALAGNTIRIRRYDAITGANSCAGELNFSLPGKVISLSELFIDSLQYIYVIGYNATDNNIFVARIANTSSTTMDFDVNYGINGIVNLSGGSNLSIVKSGALHPDGGLYVLGSQVTATPGIARVLGGMYTSQISHANKAGLPGLLDLTFGVAAVDLSRTSYETSGIILSNLTGWGTISLYVAKVVYINPDGTTLIALSDGTNVRIGKLLADMTPVMEFGINGLTNSITMSEVDSMIVDAQGRIIVSGADSGIQKVIRYSSVGTLLTTFTTTLSLSAGMQVVEQKSGRILVASKKGSIGVINAYKNTGLGEDLTYGPAGNAGWYATGVHTQIDDLVVNDYDQSYLVYRDTSNLVWLENITFNGSGKVATFNNGVAVNTGIIATEQAHVAINDQGNILVGATTSSGVVTRLYNGTTGAAISTAQTIVSTGSPILTDLTAAQNNFVGSIYTTTPEMIAFRVLGSTGLIDPDFGESGLASGQPYSAIVMNHVAIQPDGKILMVGNSSTLPLVMRFYGTSYQSEFAQYPGAAAVGTINISLAPTDGALNLDTLLSSGSLNLDACKVKRLHEYGNGIILLVCESSSDTILIRLQKDLTLDTSFNSVGYIVIEGKINPRGLFVDDVSGTIYVAGGAATSWLAAYDTNGLALSGWTMPVAQLTGGAYEVSQQTLGRILVAGQSGNGAIYGYTNTGDLDPSFGLSGVATTGVGAAILDFFVDSYDRITYIYVQSGTVILKQFCPNGFSNIALNSGTAITGVTNNEAKVVHDNLGNIIIAAATIDGFVIRRYDSMGANSAPSALTIAAGSNSSSHLGNMYVTSDNKIVIVGYELTGNRVVVARLTSSFTLDTTFNSNGSEPGILMTSVGNMNFVYDGTIHADNQIILVGGSNIAADPYIASVYGDDYVLVVGQGQNLQSPGINDITLGQTGTNGVSFFAIPGTGSAQGQIPQTVALQGYNKIIIGVDGQDASSTQSKVFLNLFTNDGLSDTTFNTTGQAQVPHNYANEYIRDVVTFSSVSGVHKAILAGYATSGSPLNVKGSWLMQYNIDSVTTDSSFGGLYQAGPGIVFGDALEFHAVGTQSTSRVIASGLNYDNTGVIIGYTSTGILDKSFGRDGYFSQNITGLYTHAIDTKNRIVIAYNDGANNVILSRVLANGSGLDGTFGTAGIVRTGISGISGNDKIRVAVDASGRVLVVAVNNSGTNYVVRRYAADGLSYVENVIQGATDLAGVTSLSLAKLLVDVDGKAIIVGSCADNVAEWMLIVRISTTITTLDTTFNSTITPGYLKYAIDNNNSSRSLTDGVISSDGRIITIGSETL